MSWRRYSRCCGNVSLKKTEYHATLRTGEERLEISWKVLAHQEYGYPGPFDREVHKALEHLLSEMRPPLVNPIPLGSLYNIAKLMGLKDSGRTYQDIRQAIKRIISTVLESKGAFYRKGVGKRGTDTFHLYDRAIFLGETLPDGTVADTNYLFLGTWYLESINARYVKPLDYGFYRSLHGHVASRLYELLGVKFYRMGPHPYIKYRYSNICQLLPVTRHRYFSQAKQKLDPAHQELIRKDFFKDVEWTKIPGESNDWYVSYWPGPRAKEELSRFPRQPALTQEAAQGAPQVPPAGPLEEDEPTTPVAGKDTSRKSRTLPEFTQAQLEASKELQGLGCEQRDSRVLVSAQAVGSGDRRQAHARGGQCLAFRFHQVLQVAPDVGRVCRHAGAAVLEAPSGEVFSPGDVGAPGVGGPAASLRPGVGQDVDVGQRGGRSLRRRQ